MISRGRRLLWGALQGALETGVNMAEESRAYRRGYKHGIADAAAALGDLLDQHWNPDSGSVEFLGLGSDVAQLREHLDEHGRPPAPKPEAERVDVTG